jgi:hypothetical protein
VNSGESVRRTEQEIHQAKAEALGRTGERLEVILAELAVRDRQLDAWRANAGSGTGPGGERLARQTEARNRLRDEASQLHPQLIIQREAGRSRSTIQFPRAAGSERRAVTDS